MSVYILIGLIATITGLCLVPREWWDELFDGLARDRRRIRERARILEVERAANRLIPQHPEVAEAFAWLGEDPANRAVAWRQISNRNDMEGWMLGDNGAPDADSRYTLFLKNRRTPDLTAEEALTWAKGAGVRLRWLPGLAIDIRVTLDREATVQAPGPRAPREGGAPCSQ